VSLRLQVLAYIYFYEDNQYSTFTIFNAGGNKPQVTVQKLWHNVLLLLFFGWFPRIILIILLLDGNFVDL
jgi:hypothetical protein